MIKSCKGAQSNYTTFEKLVYCGESLDSAKEIEHACHVFRSRFHTDAAIVQCCVKGFIGIDELNQINESHCGIIIDPANVRQIILKRKLAWREFVKHLRLKV